MLVLSIDTLSVIEAILGVANAVLGVFNILVAYKNKEVSDVSDFGPLHKAMTDEMEELVRKDSGSVRHLHILSYTPAFGNISAPERYEEGNNPKTYKYLLDQIVAKGPLKIDVKIICYDEKKRFEYHKKWAAIIGRTETEMNTYIDKWEKQAKEVINMVRRKYGFCSVREVKFIHPILFFSTDTLYIEN